MLWATLWFFFLMKASAYFISPSSPFQKWVICLHLLLNILFTTWFKYREKWTIPSKILMTFTINLMMGLSYPGKWNMMKQYLIFFFVWECAWNTHRQHSQLGCYFLKEIKEGGGQYKLKQQKTKLESTTLWRSESQVWKSINRTLAKVFLEFQDYW